MPLHKNAARRGIPGGAFETVQRGSGHSKATKTSDEPQAARLTASHAAVFEIWWVCPFCAENAYFEVDLHPFTFAALGHTRKMPALACSVPRCREFIPKDIEQSMIDRLVTEPAGGAA